MFNRKYFNEFTEEEKEGIRELNHRWFIAEMSDSYTVTMSEQDTLLRQFNEKYGYHFTYFAHNFRDDEEAIWFE